MAINPKVLNTAKALSSFDSISTQNSNNSVVVALAALAIVTDPFAVGSVPELAVVVIFAIALC